MSAYPEDPALQDQDNATAEWFQRPLFPGGPTPAELDADLAEMRAADEKWEAELMASAAYQAWAAEQGRISADRT